MHLSCSETWSCRALELITSWGLLDWPAWLATLPSCSYKTYVKKVLADASLEGRVPRLAKHLRPLPYLALSPCPSMAFNNALLSKLPWLALLDHRSLSRMPCGLITLGHKNHCLTSAQVQQFIFCGKRFSSVVAYVTCSCPVFAANRDCLRVAGVHGGS